jgi:hypothetical protein
MVIHCKKSVLKIQEYMYIHEGTNLKFYIPEFFNFKLLIPEYSPIYRFWFQTAAYFFLQCIVCIIFKSAVGLGYATQTEFVYFLIYGFHVQPNYS